MPRLSESSEREHRDALSSKEREPRPPEPSAGTSPPVLSESSSRMEDNALSPPELEPEPSGAEVKPRVESSEDSKDKDKSALSTEEDSADGLDAPGVRASPELRSQEDSREVPPSASSGKLVKLKELSAGATDQELSEDSSEEEEDALSGLELEEDGSSAPELDSKVNSSESSLDKDKHAELSVKDNTDGLSAHGLVPSRVPRSPRDSPRDKTDALSGPREKPTRLFAGTSRDLSSRATERELRNAQSGRDQELNGFHAEDHGDSDQRADSCSREPRLSEDS